ncbi:hypothetical protein [Leifsonia shinshuensis]|uniref:hypothetical protein n=1 Tax=Leifsonia shinshuensis TaxID=150026 RepID=UPI0035E6ABE6
MMKETKVIIRDLQTGGFSAHRTVEGLADDLYQDMCSDVETWEANGKLDFYSWSTPQRNLEIIDMYDYEVLYPTPSLIKQYEDYHKRAFERG